MTEVKRISFSELKNWKECPYRHKLIHIDKVPYFEGNEFTAFGSAVHGVCEEIIPDNTKNPVEIFDIKFLKELKTLKEQGKDLNDALIKDMRKQAVEICNQILPAVKQYFGDFKLVSVEEEILEPIKEFESYGKSFKGFIDLTIRTPDGK